MAEIRRFSETEMLLGIHDRNFVFLIVVVKQVTVFIISFLKGCLLQRAFPARRNVLVAVYTDQIINIKPRRWRTALLG